MLAKLYMMLVWLRCTWAADAMGPSFWGEYHDKPIDAVADKELHVAAPHWLQWLCIPAS